MNKIILMGRLTAEPEIRTTTGANAMEIAHFSLAVDRVYKREGQPTADFFRCQAFGKTEEIVKQYLHKGSKILVEGRVQLGSYVNKEGAKVNTTDVIVERFEFCESKSAAQNNGGNAMPIPDEVLNVPDGYEDEGLPF